MVSFCLIFACAKTPVTGRRVLILTSEAEEAQLGRDAYQQMLQKARVSDNRPWTEILNRAAARVAKASDQPHFQWEFKLIESSDKNAFCLPGGKIAVYTGLFTTLVNEAQLAAVLGHEIAHATARHAGQRITLQFGEQIGFAALQKIVGGPYTNDKKLLFQALGLGVQVGAVLPYNRMQEAEADHLGEVYMAIAGYDPNASVALWQEMAKDGSKAPEFLSTHPDPAKRILALLEHLPQALEQYERSPKHGAGEVIPHY